MNTIAFMPLLLGTLYREAEAGFPEEVCGILIGREMGGERGAWRLVEKVERVANGAAEGERERRFWIDPKSLLEAERAASAAGQTILGVFHSHPNGAARPSKTDREQAWAVYSYVILAVHEGRTVDITSWEMDEGTGEFKEQVIVDSTAVEVSED